MTQKMKGLKMMKHLQWPLSRVDLHPHLPELHVRRDLERLRMIHFPRFLSLAIRIAYRAAFLFLKIFFSSRFNKRFLSSSNFGTSPYDIVGPDGAETGQVLRLLNRKRPTLSLSKLNVSSI